MAALHSPAAGTKQSAILRSGVCLVRGRACLVAVSALTAYPTLHLLLNLPTMCVCVCSDLCPVPCQTVTVKWRGKPVFIRHRTPEEIALAEGEDIVGFRDPQTDAERVVDPKVRSQQAQAACTRAGAAAAGRQASAAAAA